jgi:hypothetical protein
MSNTDNQKQFRPERHDRFWTGVALVVIGAVLFLDKMGTPFPHWLFTWPMILIIVGLVSGFKHRFENISWILLILIGGVFLSDEIFQEWNLHDYFWPIAIAGLGLLFIARPRRQRYCRRDRGRFPEDPDSGGSTTYTNPGGGWQQSTGTNTNTNTAGSSNYGSEDYINSTSIFGGVKKVVFSKNFQGGEIICFMGGAEFNLSQADIQAPVTIEIMQAFGGTKLIVPPHWEIRAESVAIFGGVDDKRPPQPGSFDPNKVLILKGTTIFGGVEIKSY